MHMPCHVCCFSRPLLQHQPTVLASQGGMTVILSPADGIERLELSRQPADGRRGQCIVVQSQSKLEDSHNSHQQR